MKFEIKTPPNTSSSSKSTSTPAALLDAARERTTELGAKVQSSLKSITPHENIYNLPNFLTVTRLFAAPATAYLLLHDQHNWALALFAYAGITDLVDGWMARKWKLQTVAGSVIDPMADKALMIIVTVTLAVKGAIPGMRGNFAMMCRTCFYLNTLHLRTVLIRSFPAYLATLILGRDASLGIAAFYYRYASLPSPKTFLRYWDFSLPSAEVHPTTLSKYNTFLQLILIGSTLALPVVTTNAHSVESLNALGLDAAHLHLYMTYFQYLVAATTAWSGLQYAYLKNAVTILGTNEELKAKQGARGRAIIGVTFGSLVLLAAWQLINADNAKVEEAEPAIEKRASS
jgi:cardiolipin synthase